MRQLVYTVFISDNCVSFQLRWREHLVKYQKFSKYYETDFSLFKWKNIHILVQKKLISSNEKKNFYINQEEKLVSSNKKIFTAIAAWSKVKYQPGTFESSHICFASYNNIIMLHKKLIPNLIIVKRFASVWNIFSYIQPTFTFHIQEAVHNFHPQTYFYH